MNGKVITIVNRADAQTKLGPPVRPRLAKAGPDALNKDKSAGHPHNRSTEDR